MDKQHQFATLLTKHKGIVCQVIKTYCAHDEATQDDLFQDISLKAWEAFHTFTGKSQFSSWLWSIARNTAIDRLRRLKQFSVILTDNFLYEIEDIPYEEEATRLNINSVMDLLTDREKTTLQFRMNGLSFAEISIQMNEPISRLTVRMHRIKKMLADSIRDHTILD